jgi:hypothetical protein
MDQSPDKSWTILWMITLGLVFLMLLIIAALNASPTDVPADDNIDISFTWQADAHTVYGWPWPFYRVFDKPSVNNQDATFDGRVLALDVFFWIGMCLFCLLPPVVWWMKNFLGQTI